VVALGEAVPESDREPPACALVAVDRRREGDSRGRQELFEQADRERRGLVHEHGVGAVRCVGSVGVGQQVARGRRLFEPDAPAVSSIDFAVSSIDFAVSSIDPAVFTLDSNLARRVVVGLHVEPQRLQQCFSPDEHLAGAPVLRGRHQHVFSLGGEAPGRDARRAGLAPAAVGLHDDGGGTVVFSRITLP
jgi:hypothetical protein